MIDKIWCVIVAIIWMILIEIESEEEYGQTNEYL